MCTKRGQVKQTMAHPHNGMPQKGNGESVFPHKGIISHYLMKKEVQTCVFDAQLLIIFEKKTHFFFCSHINNLCKGTKKVDDIGWLCGACVTGSQGKGEICHCTPLCGF